jgi:hypothetical protein
LRLEVHYTESCVCFVASMLIGPVVFFEGNELTFSVSAQSQVPHSLSPAQIFGPLGAQHRIHLLRDLRRVRLVLDIDDGGYWAIVRHRSRIEHFVKILNEHAEYENRKSYLNQLTVSIARNGKVYPFDPLIAKHKRQSFSGMSVEWYIFALDVFLDLHPIKKVKVFDLPDWFVKCLEMGVRGEGGEVAWFKRHPERFKSATEKWHQPTLDWMEFAARNDIELPGDVKRLSMVER